MFILQSYSLKLSVSYLTFDEVKLFVSTIVFEYYKHD